MEYGNKYRERNQTWQTRLEFYPYIPVGITALLVNVQYSLNKKNEKNVNQYKKLIVNK